MGPKYIFVTGGVVSSLGKGLAASSIGALLESRGLKVTLQKYDPYLNVDPGTMSPYQHGEVYVTDDGAETDLDLGHYERFTHARLTRDHNWTAGRIYEAIIAKERRGDYLGKTVQVVPHVTDEIKAAVRKVADGVDVIIAEIGGTVGDIESLPFLEAIRQMRLELGPENTLFVHVTLVPFIETTHELKTKPTQHSVKELREIGIQPDILLCRTAHPLTHDIKAKIALFCSVPEEAVITARDVESIYEVPLMLAEEALDEQILRRLRLPSTPADLGSWRDLVFRIQNPADTVTIGVVGKYVELHDSYKSLGEALVHGGLAHNLRTEIAWIESEGLESKSIPLLRDSRGWTASSSPAASASAASPGCSKPSATPARIRFRFSASALGCSARSSSSPATSADWPRPTRPSSTPPPPTASSTSCASCSGLRSSAAPCAWAPGPASSSRSPSPRAPTARRKSPSATATATSSTASTRRP